MERWVNVLISTYNGKKYIEEQIDSILHQTYPNIRIYVRDDGSTDGTVELIKEKYPQVTVWTGKNVGHGKSFYELVQDTPAQTPDDNTYWAFSDQDDVWLPQKIEWAVDWFEQMETASKKEGKKIQPLLFHSSYEMVSEDLQQVIGSYTPPKYKITFQKAVTDSVFQGFSIVFNSALRALFLKCKEQNITSHDWLLGLIVERFGVAKFDPRIASKHRRLSNSQSGMQLKNRMKWFIKTFQGDADITTTATEFVRVFGEQYKEKDFKMVNWFVKSKYSFTKQMRKVFYPHRWRPSIASEISIRILMLCGRI